MNFRNNGLWNHFLNSNEMDVMKSDIYETEESQIIEIDLPGFSKDNIVIDYNNGYLTISASKEAEDKNYIHQERFFGEYSRSFYVGDINETDVKATFQDGILKVIVPKERKEAGIRRISID